MSSFHRSHLAAPFGTGIGSTGECSSEKECDGLMKTVRMNLGYGACVAGALFLVCGCGSQDPSEEVGANEEAVSIPFAAPAVYVDPSGYHVLAVGPSNTLWQYSSATVQAGSIWSPYQVGADSTTFSAPAVVVQPTGEVDIAAMGAPGAYDNSLAFASSLSSPLALTQVGNLVSSMPALAVTPTGMLVGATMSSTFFGLNEFWFTNTPSGPRGPSECILGDTAFGPPAVAVHASGQIDVAVQGPNNSLLYGIANLPSTCGGPLTQIAGPGTTYSAPSITIRNSDEVDIAVMGPQKSLFVYSLRPGGSWVSVQVGGPQTIFSAPSITSRPTDWSNEADVVAVGPNNSLSYYFNRFSSDPSFGWWSTMNQVAAPGTTSSPPSILVHGEEADVVAADPTGGLVLYWATPGSPWTTVQVAGPGSAG
jgi:hypothetical protein